MLPDSTKKLFGTGTALGFDFVRAKRRATETMMNGRSASFRLSLKRSW